MRAEAFHEIINSDIRVRAHEHGVRHLPVRFEQFDRFDNDARLACSRRLLSAECVVFATHPLDETETLA
jgi:hypothetical protein